MPSCAEWLRIVDFFDRFGYFKVLREFTSLIRLYPRGCK